MVAVTHAGAAAVKVAAMPVVADIARVTLLVLGSRKGPLKNWKYVRVQSVSPNLFIYLGG